VPLTLSIEALLTGVQADAVFAMTTLQVKIWSEFKQVIH